METFKALGFDIGGTSVKGGLVGDQGQIVSRVQFKTPKDPRDLVDGVVRAIEDLSQGSPYRVGISTAGTVDIQKQQITGLGGNIENWKGFDIGQAFKDRGLSIGALDNDANCALKAELVAGAAKGQSPVLMITLGTGIGGALSIDGKGLYHGANYSALEIGHIILDSQGEICSCGQRGCAETFLSAKAFHQAMVKEGCEEADYFLGQKDHPYVQLYWDHMSNYIVSLENTLNPSLIIIGGGFVDYAPSFVSLLENRVQKKSNGAGRARILKALFNNDAGLIGAAFLAREVENESIKYI